MSPLPRNTEIPHIIYETSLETRNFESKNASGVAVVLTPEQETILQCIAVTFSTLSFASAILVFYWFVKMQRRFRHNLIMLLIMSDLFKALWLLSYPIITFTRGPIHIDFKFCKINGFFLSLGIEASDFAVLMISVHAALCIFKPTTSAGEGGLYPYRRVSYVLWVVFPVVMASLAFINGENAYVPEGTFCYLPVRPFWYRLALSWIPRYMIFIIILGICFSIYYYVRYQLHGFNNYNSVYPVQHNVNEAHKLETPRSSKRLSLPATPPLAHHRSVLQSRGGSVNSEPCDRSQISGGITLNDYNISTETTVTPRLTSVSFATQNNPLVSSAVPSEFSTVDAELYAFPSTPQNSPTMSISHFQNNLVQSSSPFRSRVRTWCEGFIQRTRSGKSSVFDIFAALRRHPESTNISTPLSQLRLVNAHSKNLAAPEMLHNRERIRRQLRFLFIYPLVFLLIWTVPLVSHIIQYDNKFTISPPFGLSCVTTVCLCMQAAVDCLLFSAREKPWTLISGNDRGVFRSLRLWSC